MSLGVESMLSVMGRGGGFHLRAPPSIRVNQADMHSRKVQHTRNYDHFPAVLPVVAAQVFESEN